MAYFAHALIYTWPEPFKSINGISLHAPFIVYKGFPSSLYPPKAQSSKCWSSYSEKPSLIAEAKQLELCQPEHQTPPC